MRLKNPPPKNAIISPPRIPTASAATTANSELLRLDERRTRCGPASRTPGTCSRPASTPCLSGRCSARTRRSASRSRLPDETSTRARAVSSDGSGLSRRPCNDSVAQAGVGWRAPLHWPQRSLERVRRDRPSSAFAPQGSSGMPACRYSPHGAQHTATSIEETPEALRIVMPVQRVGCVAVFLAAWLCGWFFGEVSAISALFRMDIAPEPRRAVPGRVARGLDRRRHRGGRPSSR